MVWGQAGFFSAPPLARNSRSPRARLAFASVRLKYAKNHACSAGYSLGESTLILGEITPGKQDIRRNNPVSIELESHVSFHLFQYWTIGKPLDTVEYLFFVFKECSCSNMAQSGRCSFLTGSPSSLVTVNMTLRNGVIIRVCMGNTSILRNSSK